MTTTGVSSQTASAQLQTYPGDQLVVAQVNGAQSPGSVFLTVQPRFYAFLTYKGWLVGYNTLHIHRFWVRRVLEGQVMRGLPPEASKNRGDGYTASKKLAVIEKEAA